MTEIPFDSLILVSFGGPEGPDDVIPFLENVLRGRNVPRERMLEVAEHYQHFGGVSPLNAQNRRMIAELADELARVGISLPMYWGNRNWHPMLPDTVRQMRDDGRRRALAFFTSAYSSYSGCRQYRENVEAARQAVGPDAPRIEKLRAFYNHPGFIEATIQCVREALTDATAERGGGASRSSSTTPAPIHLIYTAHSIPLAMAESCRYEAQLREVAELASQALGISDWKLVFQSRSGPPSQPWLEPDVCSYLRELSSRGHRRVVIAPIGFLSDHMEVMFDLDTEARAVCDELGITMVRASTVGTQPRFIRMIRELIQERLDPIGRRATVGTQPAVPDLCPVDCCPVARPRV